MHIGMTQYEFAEKLEARQATISEWECGIHTPRRMMRLILTVLADEAHFPIGGIS